MHKRSGEKFHAATLFDGERWLERVTIEVGGDGLIRAMESDSAGAGAEIIAGPVIPGMPNLHSHAFQRAMAGLAEFRVQERDDFWSWREAMYRLGGSIEPAALEAVATQAYVEMLKAGYTAVCEFNYLHRDPGGARYADPAELSRRLLAAAERAGIGITLLPVLYQRGGFDGRGLEPRQQRFGLTTAEYLALLETVASLCAGEPDRAWGVAFHSLRAVEPAAMDAVLGAFEAPVPVHIHVAEQEREVAECVAHTGARPVAWLIERIGLGPRWTLVHATHSDPDETATLARSGAVAGLCPTTEANLGDGFFPLVDYLHAGGAFGVGSDSQVSISPIEELRWLEYGSRLRHQRRNTVASAAEAHCGTLLWRGALAGGGRAAGRPIGRLRRGARADWLVLDPASPLWIAEEPETLLDLLIFSGNQPPVRDVMVGGRWRVRDRCHRHEEAIRRRFLDACRQVKAWR